MLGSKRECQIPELGRTDEIQNYLHGSANADDSVGVMETNMLRPELVAALVFARAVMCVNTLASHTEVTCSRMIIWESYRLCRHQPGPLASPRFRQLCLLVKSRRGIPKRQSRADRRASKFTDGHFPVKQCKCIMHRALFSTGPAPKGKNGLFFRHRVSDLGGTLVMMGPGAYSGSSFRRKHIAALDALRELSGPAKVVVSGARCR